MKCVKCKFSIPFSAEVCGHCGNETFEQKWHLVRFNLAYLISSVISFLVIILPYILLIDSELNLAVLALAILTMFVAGHIIFKKVFKGEYMKF
jgi:uncharacterized paraquat-inducible protein A